MGDEFTAVKVSAVASRTEVAPGGELAIAVVLDHAAHFHSWPSAEQDVLPPEIAEFAIRTQIGLAEAPAWVGKVGSVQWPTPQESKVADPTGEKESVTLPTYLGKAVAYVPLLIADGAIAGDQTLTVKVSYQACDERTCLPPEDVEVQVSVRIVAPGTAPQGATPEQIEAIKGFDQGAFATLRSGSGGGSQVAASGKPLQFNIFKWKFSINPDGATGHLLLFVVAALGGLLLNFTPCVLPVIPLKILSLSSSASNPARCLLLGLVMSVGVVFFWMLLAVAIVSIKGFNSISSLFQTDWFAIVVGAVILVFGVGMIGLFTVRLPQAVYAINPANESVGGSFVFGIMTAVLSTPCTAPLMGVAAAWATRQPVPTTLATFAAIGAGMALPYLVLAANPKWVKKVPKSGPASELVKQVMGLLMLAVAAFFLGTGIVSLMTKAPDPPSRVYWWLVAAFSIAAGVWLIVRTFGITKSFAKRAVFTVVGLGLAAGAFGAASVATDHGPVNWVYYTPERMEQAKREGKVVVVDFTAEWCLNCKALEKAVLFRKDVSGALNGSDVVAMKVDLTGNNAEGKALMKSVDRVAIPLLAVFGPGRDEPFLSDAYTPQQVLDAVEDARK